jgi:uncharacterized protein YjlB
MAKEPEAHRFEDDGAIPNSRYPALVYRAVLAPGETDRFEDLFADNGWTGSWRNGIFPYHHYHSTAHEVLGVASGTACVQLGGEDGETFDFGPGDVVVIPAGVGHKRLSASDDFVVVGAYDRGRDWDILKGEPGERPKADEDIAAVPVPDADPVLGERGGLTRLWQD